MLSLSMDDAMSSVGNRDYLEHGEYIGAVVGIDRCVYEVPVSADSIARYDPINDITSFDGEEAEIFIMCCVNGALGRDGCIYALGLSVWSTENYYSQ